MTIKDIFGEISQRLEWAESDRMNAESPVEYKIGGVRKVELFRAQYWMEEITKTIQARIEEIRAEAKQTQELWLSLCDISSPDISLVANATIKELKKILGETEAEVQQ